MSSRFHSAELLCHGGPSRARKTCTPHTCPLPDHRASAPRTDRPAVNCSSPTKVACGLLARIAPRTARTDDARTLFRRGRLCLMQFSVRTGVLHHLAGHRLAASTWSRSGAGTTRELADLILWAA